MCDEPRSRMTVAEKLELLAAHATAWRLLHAVHHEWVESLVGWSVPLAVSGNLLVFSKRCNGVRSEHQPDVSATPAEVYLNVRLLVVRVPSPLRLIKGDQWVLWLPEGVGNLCIDAAQDLLLYTL